MIELRAAALEELGEAMGIINGAKRHLKEQGIDQWQTGYPDEACIRRDIVSGKGFMVVDGNEVLGYLCVDYDGEPAYEGLNGEWKADGKYVVVHRMAFAENARGKGLSSRVFALVEEMSRERGVHAFRVDTDADNRKMLHVLEKCGFMRRGTILFDNSEKVAFDKTF